MDSILVSIKKMLGIGQDDTNFDQDIIININSVLMFINQLGIGPETGFSITGDSETWSDIIGDRIDLDAIKTYVYLRVRLTFDPPASAFVLESIDRQIVQLEWRLNVQAENAEEET